MITVDDIKKLRDRTGLSIMLCKEALEESGGDEAGAVAWLKEKGVETAEKKSERNAKAGLIETYVHAGQVGVILEIRSETDFVAKNSAFKELAHNIAMHIVASDPEDVKELMEQSYIKNPEQNISDYITSAIQKFGENIEVRRFVRYET